MPKLANFTNHDQSVHSEFFRKYGFDSVTGPLHPKVTPDMDEVQVREVSRNAAHKAFQESSCVLVQGMTNVCVYAIEYLREKGCTCYYVQTDRVRDENDRFVFIPVALRRYHD